MSKKDKHLLLSLLFLLSCSSIYAQQEYAYSPSFINGLFVYYGVLIFTIVVTLAQFFISKDRAYFYYAFYVGTGMFLYGIWQEVDFNFLGIGERPAFRNFAFHGGMPALILGYAVYCKFSIEFLNLPKKNPSLASRFQRIIKYFLLIIIIDQIVYCVLKYGTPNIYEQVYPTIRICFLSITAGLCFYAIAQIFKVKNQLAKVILLGTALYFIISLLGLYVYTFNRSTENGLLSQFHPTFFTQAGFLCEIIIFSIGLGYRMKLIEDEKEEANANYIRQLEENRRLELANTKAEKEQEINRIRSRFYTNITHEFRTPLTVIMGMADRVKNHVTERKLIKRNSQNLLRLINQLLDLSKLESGHLKLQLRQDDIINYLRYLVESFYSMAAERNLELLFQTTQENLLMDYDEDKVQHIIYNLLSNAIKFSSEGSMIVFHVSSKVVDQNSHLLIEVQDGGMGIPEDELQYIFDRFYQVRNTPSTAEIGTGIGLALTKELVELMNGSIKVNSILREGTTFFVELPISNEAALNIPSLDTKVSDEETIKQADLPTTEETNHNLGNSPQILLIEDNRDVALYIQQLLEDKYYVSWVTNGEEGIQKAIENLPDLVMSDVMMPKKNGYEVCKTLKTDERTSHIPIILLTAKAQQQDKIIGLGYGADAYLTKPFDKAELRVRIEKLLHLRQMLHKKYSQQYHFTATPPNDELSLEDIFLQKVKDVIEQEVNNAAFTIPDLCKAVHMSNIQLYRKLKALTGKTPSQFIRSYRLHKAWYLLKNTSLNISEVAYDLGFTDPAYFTRVFKKEFGITPSNIINN